MPSVAMAMRWPPQGAYPGITNVEVELTLCDREPIHVPGSIQPHGMMLVASLDGLITHHVAGDVEQRLGVPEWAGQPLDMLLGEVLAGRIAALLEQNSGGFAGQIATLDGEVLDVSAHRSGDYLIVELEPATKIPLPASLASLVLEELEAAAVSFEQAPTLQALCDLAAIEFRRITGFDRVMVYHFLDDDAGRVLAEARQDDLHSFANHHFPASDIPRQARALYVRNRTRVIPDIFYEPAPLRPEWTAPTPLDMSDSSLRSVSPIHLRYLDNMGVRASASVSIVKDGALWGLIACHNEAPRMMTFDVRVACRALAGAMARQIKVKAEAGSLRQRIELRAFEDEIVHKLSATSAPSAALLGDLDELGRMFGADGVAVLQAGELVTHGACPTEDQVRALADWVLARAGETVFSTDRLAEDYPAAQQFRERGSGLLAMSVGVETPWLLLWFRAEQAETVNWAGNPHKNANPDPIEVLTPRASFGVWREAVRGRARRWTAPEIDAATRLRDALLEVRQTRQVRELNQRLTETLRDKDVLLTEKEFLIGEVNHRVQNSLQLVSSFLTLQARKSDNIVLHDALEEARRRLSAVGLVHRRLYRGDQIETIDAARYVEELCEDALSSMGQDWGKFLSLDLVPVTLSADRAITLGLIVAELITNINKHAYSGKAGPIEIRLTNGSADFCLVVADKGQGNASSQMGFGTRMMDALVAQLGGGLAYESNALGLRAVLTAPITGPRQAN